jgi:leucyl/phenylalanyl-tRNA--protein transferase
MPVFRLAQHLSFPPPHLAIREGLLAVGGDLSPERLILAYRQGIFPWYAEDDPILWWSPDPRLVLYPAKLHITRSLSRVLRRKTFAFSLDAAFEEVIGGCAAGRDSGGGGTWILPEMIAAYLRLHAAGWAHSMEAWQGGQLAGGLYGVSLGGCFFGESMFTRVSNASKAALVVLVQNLAHMGFRMLDCQVPSQHLMRFGAQEIPRARFLRELQQALRQPSLRGTWRLAPQGGIVAINGRCNAGGVEGTNGRPRDRGH